MADVKKVMGVDLSKIKDIYDSAISGLAAIMGVVLGSSSQPTESVDFEFSGNYTPPDGGSVDFF